MTISIEAVTAPFNRLFFRHRRAPVGTDSLDVSVRPESELVLPPLKQEQDPMPLRPVSGEEGREKAREVAQQGKTSFLVRSTVDPVNLALDLGHITSAEAFDLKLQGSRQRLELARKGDLKLSAEDIIFLPLQIERAGVVRTDQEKEEFVKASRSWTSSEATHFLPFVKERLRKPQV